MTTPNRGYPFPGVLYQPHGPNQIEALARAVDLDVVSFLAGLQARLTPVKAVIATSQTTATTTYTNLATIGPTVTVTTGATAIVILTARVRNDSVVARVCMTVDITGATTIPASDDTRALEHEGTGWQRSSLIYLQSGLTPGSNIFKAEYRTTAGTGRWEDRELTVIPLY